MNKHVCIAGDVKATAVALSDDESALIVRVSHTLDPDPAGHVDHSQPPVTVVVSRFIVVDVTSGQYVGTVGPPCHGVAAPASAEYVDDVDRRILLVAYPVLSQNFTGIIIISCCDPFFLSFSLFLVGDDCNTSPSY